jgi:hypothetical protein
MVWPFGKKAEATTESTALKDDPDGRNDQIDLVDEESEYEPDEEEAEETPEERRERIKSENLGECAGIFCFFVYLLIFSTSILLEQAVSSSRLADHIRLKMESGPMPLSKVTTIDQFYVYLEDSFLPAMFENATDARLASELSQSFHPIDVSNRMVGSVRFRQSRVRLEPNCQISPMFAKYTVSCYPAYSPASESKSTFGPEGKFRFSVDPDGSAMTGTLASYNPHGFMQFLSTNRTKAKMKIKSLRDDGFLGTATRAAFLDFAIWSSNTGTYAAVTVLVEFGPTGSTYAETAVLILTERNVKFLGLGFMSDIISNIFHFVVLVFVFYYMYEEAKEFWASRLEYFTDGWNVLDWINMILIIVAFVLRVQVFLSSGKAQIGTGALLNKDQFRNLRGMGDTAELVRMLGALNSVLLWLKCVKYLRKVPVVKELIRTIWDALYLFMPFLFMFCLAYVGFVMSFNVGFGDKIKELSTVRSTVVYLARSYLRDVKLMPAYDIAPLFGAVMILLFYVTLVLVGVTVVNAIFSDAIYRGKMNPREEDPDHEDEPVEEFQRFCVEMTEKAIDTIVPRRYQKYFKKKPPPVHEEDFFDDPMALEDEEDLGDEDSEWDSEDEGDDVPITSRQDLLRSIEHMSGRVLSEISIVGIEIRSELHDVCERVAQMQMAVSELEWRADRIGFEQSEVIT